MSTNQPSATPTQTSGHATLMWVWFWTSTIASGVGAGFVFGNGSGSSGFSGAGLVGGLVGGAIVAIPTMVVVDLLLKLLAAIRARPVVQANAIAEPLSSSPVVDPPLSDEARAEDHAQSLRVRLESDGQVAAPAPSRLDTVEGKLIARLLEDPRLVEEGRLWTKRGYGRDVVAGSLRRKALELGLGEVEITADDLPTKF